MSVIDAEVNSFPSSQVFDEEKSRAIFSTARLGKIALSAIALLSSAAIISSPEVTTDARLLGDIAISDVNGATSELLTHQPEVVSESQLLENYHMDNGMFKTGPVGWYASTWPTSRALEATYVASLTNKKYLPIYEKSLAVINKEYWTHSYASSGSFDQGITAFHNPADVPLDDDNQWMGQLDIENYKQTHQKIDLSRAEDIFRLATTEWDNKACGVYWQMQQPLGVSHGRAAVSNFPAASLGYEIYSQTGNYDYLFKSAQIYNCANKLLYSPSSGVYNDHISQGGQVNHWKFTYVQAVAAGSMAELVSVPKAVAFSVNAMNYFKTHQTYGDPTFDSIWGQEELWLAAKYSHPWFTQMVKKSIKEAMAVEPKNPSSLEYYAGEVELRGLNKLPYKDYHKLF